MHHKGIFFYLTIQFYLTMNIEHQHTVNTFYFQHLLLTLTTADQCPNIWLWLCFTVITVLLFDIHNETFNVILNTYCSLYCILVSWWSEVSECLEPNHSPGSEALIHAGTGGGTLALLWEEQISLQLILDFTCPNSFYPIWMASGATWRTGNYPNYIRHNIIWS